MENENIKENLEQTTENQAIQEKSLWKKITKYAQNAGIKTVYTALLLYYAFRRKDTPAWAKRIITGTLAYFIAPFDAIPDLTPFLGFTDDIGILGLGLVAVAAYINDEVKVKSKAQLTSWFGEFDEKELESVDDKL